MMRPTRGFESCMALIQTAAGWRSKIQKPRTFFFSTDTVVSFAPPPPLMNRIARFVLPFVCLGTLFIGASFALAKPVLPKDGPPVLMPVDIRVEGRTPALIVLRARGFQRESVRFVLRGQPEHGRARLVRQLSADAVEVEYIPPADLRIVADTFLFAGSNAQGFSGDSRVRIQIVDKGVVLSVPQTVDFTAVTVGHSSRMPLEVLNSGDQSGRLKVQVSPPWELEEGELILSLTPGERRTIGVLYKPSKVGWSLGELRFSGAASAVVQLRAEANDWVEVAQDPVILRWGDSLEQSAELVLSNRGSDALELNLQTTPGLQHEPQVRIEAGASLGVPLRWRGNAVSEGKGTLTLLSKGGMRRVVFWSLDSILSGLGSPFVLTGEPVPFEAQRTLTNVGGQTGVWTFRCTPPFYLEDGEKGRKATSIPAPQVGGLPASPAPSKSPEPQPKITGFVRDEASGEFVLARGEPKRPAKEAGAAGKPKDSPAAAPKPAHATEVVRRLSPGESFVLRVGLEGRTPVGGGTLFVSGPGKNHSEPLLLKGEPVVLTKTATPRKDPVTKPPERLPPPALAGGAALPPPDTERRTGAGVLPRLLSEDSKKPKPPPPPPPPPPQEIYDAFVGVKLKGFYTKDVTSNAATIGFVAAPDVSPGQLVVRYGTCVGMDETGRLAFDWKPFAPSDRKGKRVGNRIEIRLRGLKPGSPNSVDLLGTPFSDGRRERLQQIDINTPPAPGGLSPTSPWSWGGLLTLFLGAYYLWRRSR